MIMIAVISAGASVKNEINKRWILLINRNTHVF